MVQHAVQLRGISVGIQLVVEVAKRLLLGWRQGVELLEILAQIELFRGREGIDPRSAFLDRLRNRTQRICT